MDVINGVSYIKTSEKLLRKINKYNGTISIMEVCGTHTSVILKSGIRELLHENIKLISGPGCPVCVTPQEYIDTAIALSKENNVIIATFGDLIRVPGTTSNLKLEKALGRDIRVVYSPLDCLKIAKENQAKEVVFLSVGFETTAPIIALAIYNANNEKIKNFSILNGLKTMPKAMENIILNSEINIDGFICPGHVATIIGSNKFNSIAKKYKTPMVISGFEIIDIMSAIYELIIMKENYEIGAKNFYSRLVREEGNTRALNTLNEIFEPCNSIWRGLGEIEETGLKVRIAYKNFDVSNKIKIKTVKSKNIDGCICGEILRGIKSPYDCKLFKKGCTKAIPIGPCMVSDEGTCSIYYNYY